MAGMPGFSDITFDLNLLDAMHLVPQAISLIFYDCHRRQAYWLYRRGN